MKTKNNVQKAILRSAAVIISFVLISFTVSAQQFWRNLIEHSSFNEIAIAMVETSDKTSTIAAKAKMETIFSSYNATDNALVLEDWMTKDSHFGITNFQSEAEAENALELEKWMINDNLFEVDNNVEQPLELESWMTSDELWKS